MPAGTLVWYLAIVLLGSALVSYVLSFASRRLAIEYRALDMPRGQRKIHKLPMPLWGGLGIAATICIAVLFLGLDGSIFQKITSWQLIGFAAGILVLNFGGLLDDKFDLKPGQAILFPVVAALIVIFTGTTIGHVTHPGTSGALFLDWWTWQPFNGFFKLVLPSDALAFVWLMVAMYAAKISDGLDGLVTGIAVIGATMVGALSALPTYYQPASAILAALVTGSYLGFLPRNMHPAKQFLGEGGATMAGFCLGFLAIVSSAKIAIAMAAMAVPVADVAIVVLRRVLNGKPWYKGDSSHLHFRLLAAGLPHRSIVWLLWLISAAAGVTALLLQTRGKIFLVLILALMTALGSWFADRQIRKRLPTVEPRNEQEK